jgi:hypothetical protein
MVEPRRLHQKGVTTPVEPRSLSYGCACLNFDFRYYSRNMWWSPGGFTYSMCCEPMRIATRGGFGLCPSGCACLDFQPRCKSAAGQYQGAPYGGAQEASPEGGNHTSGAQEPQLWVCLSGF